MVALSELHHMAHPLKPLAPWILLIDSVQLHGMLLLHLLYSRSW
jgi:hypothetical protein